MDDATTASIQSAAAKVEMLAVEVLGAFREGALDDLGRLAELVELQELERRIPSLENKAAVASGEGAALYAGVAGALTARRDALLDRLWPNAYPDPMP